MPGFESLDGEGNLRADRDVQGQILNKKVKNASG